MKRRFRQKQDTAPKEDSEKNNGVSEDKAEKNIDIDEVIREIEALLDTPGKHPEEE